MSYGNLIPLREVAEETVMDKIGKHYLAGTLNTMPNDLKSIFERWCEVLDCLESGRKVDYRGNDVNLPYGHRDLVKHLKEKFQIKQSQAYEDIANAKHFHHLAKPREDKEFARGWLAELIKKYIAICEHQNNWKVIPALIKNLIIVEGHDREHVETPDYSKIQPPELIIVDDPREAIPNLPEVKNVDKLVKELIKKQKDDFIQAIVDDSDLAEEVNGSN